MSNPAQSIGADVPAPRLRRLLVISYHYPPDGAVGGLRWAGLSKFLARAGWEVHVITAAASQEASPLGVVRHHCVRRSTLNDLYSRSVSRALPRVNSTPTTPSEQQHTRRTTVLGRIVSNIRMAARVALAFPDNGRGWVLRAGRMARQLVRERPFDAIVTSGPPHSAHFAGVIAAWGHSIPHVVDMRDPWRGANRDFPAWGMDANWLHYLLAPLERFLFGRTRNVVVNTREFADALRLMQPRVTVSLVSNGTDVENLPARTSDRFEGLSIAYVGTFYAGRSFETVLSALAAVVHDRPADASSIRLRIAGNMEPSQLEKLRADLSRLGLSSAVEIYGPVPRTAALDLLRRSHIALVLAQAQPTQVPAKLYECVGLGVPTVAITEDQSATASEARRIGAIIVQKGDSSKMRQVIEDALDGRLPSSIAPASPISYEALAEQMDRILNSASRGLRPI